MKIFHILELTVKVSAYAGHLLGNVVKVDHPGLCDVAGVRQRQLDLVCPSVIHLVALNVQHHQVLYQACAVVLKQYMHQLTVKFGGGLGGGRWGGRWGGGGVKGALQCRAGA